MNQSDQSQVEEKDTPQSSSLMPQEPVTLEMDNGRPRTPLSQALTIFYKRALIARRSWLTPLLVVLIAVAGSCIPIFFMYGQVQSCIKRVDASIASPLFLPYALDFFGPPSGGDDRVVISPPYIIATLGNTTDGLFVNGVPDNATFVSTIDETYSNLALGGVSLDLATGNSLVAWEASSPGIIGPTMLNLATNILFNYALNSSGGNVTLIDAVYAPFPSVDAGTLFALKWVAFFGAALVSPDMDRTYS
jgi:ATP-binding cassette, subfamily A (ABC1), member 3